MAPTHQSLVAPMEKKSSISRKPLSTQLSWDSQKTAHISEYEAERTPDDDRIRNHQWKTPQQRPKKDSLSRLWLVEFASLMVAFIAFIAIIITLLLHQDRPLPKWPSLISINTLVAIFTAILKASMLLPIAEGISQSKWLWFHDARPLIDLDRFDSASRGAWGCILLLLRRKTSQLAALGALITIIAMAVDPFAQQVIQYDYCSTTALDSAALIPRTNNYTAGVRAPNGGVGHSSGAMNAAFFGQGLFDPPLNASSNIRVTCPTGNCTFLATDNGISYMSLGMCSSCVDISQTISNSTTGGTDVTYKLPSNLTINPLGKDLVAASMVLPPAEPQSEMMITQSITTFEMLMWDSTDCEDASTQSHCRVSAARCSLTPCVKSYAANITNGILYETELSNIPLQYFPAPGGYAYFGIFTNTTIVNGRVHDCQPTNGPTKRNTLRMALGNTWVSEEYFKNISSAPYYPPECAFTLGVGSTDGLITSFQATYDTQNISGIVGVYGGQPWMLQLYDSGAATPDSLKTAISGLANAVTAAIRNEGDAMNGAAATGTVMVSQTCIRVHWEWLVLPASLLLLSSLFLAGTILHSSPASVGKAWKSSPLALLFHGFSFENGRSIGSVDRLSDMEATARKMRAQLRWEEHSWKFSAVPSEAKRDGFEQTAAKAYEARSHPQAGMCFPMPPKQDEKM